VDFVFVTRLSNKSAAQMGGAVRLGGGRLLSKLMSLLG
jgi:hypothetical protein